VTPLDLILQPNFSVNDAKSVIDLLVADYAYDPRVKAQYADGTEAKSLQESVFSIIFSRGLQKSYQCVSAKLKYLFSMTNLFSLDKLMQDLPDAEDDIVQKAIAWEDQKEYEQWHPMTCVCSTCQNHSNMLGNAPFNEDDIHDYDHP